MHRRVRHLNPRFAGASLVLDARYINEANNTAIATWPDISGSGNNATQATSGKRPIFKTGLQGGQPVVTFSTGGMVCSSGLGGATSQFIVILALKSYNYNGTAGGGMLISQGSVFTTDFLLGRTSTLYFFEYDAGTNGGGNLTAPGAGNQIHTVVYNGGGAANADRLRFIYNGIQQTLTFDYTVPASLNPAGAYHIGQYAVSQNDTAWYYNGDMCSLLLIKQDISSSLRKRLEQSQALSFKIPCS